MIKKSITLILIAILAFGTISFAEELNLEQAIEMATEDTSNIDTLNDVIEDLWDTYYSAQEGKRMIQKNLDTMADFEALHDKKYKDKESLSPQETFELEMYQMMYGETPPKFTNQEMLDQFIKPRDFAYKAVYIEIQKLKNTRTTINLNMEAVVRGLYNQVIELQDLLLLQTNYLEIAQEQYQQDVLKYEVGDISEDALEISALNLKVLEYQIKQLEININTLEMNFNQLIDRNVLERVILVDPVDEITTVEPIHKSLETYLSDAIKNRAEIKNARLDLEVKKREESIIKTYLKNELLTDRVNAEIAVIQTSYALEQAEAEVKDNITDGFIETSSLWQDYIMSISDLTIKTNHYKDMSGRYEVGYINKTTLDLIEYQVKMSENTVKSNLRNYLNAVDKMDKASGLGPAY